MKKLNLLAAITVACSALISGLQAAPITYSIVNNAAFQNKLSEVGSYTLSGSITTDGTIGDVTSGILGWNWTVTDNATSAVVRSVAGNGATGGSYSVQASATQITLKPFGEGSALKLSGDVSGSGQLAWIRRSGDPMDGAPAIDEYYFQYIETLWYEGSNQPLALSSTAGGSWIIADGGVSTVPEPSTYGLLCGGFTLAVVAMRRRTIKQA